MPYDHFIWVSPAVGALQPAASEVSISLLLAVQPAERAEEHGDGAAPRWQGEVKKDAKDWGTSTSFQPRWDTWGRLTEPLFSQARVTPEAFQHSSTLTGCSVRVP